MKNFIKNQRLIAVESLIKADSPSKLSDAGLSLIDIELFTDYFEELVLCDGEQFDVQLAYPEAFNYLAKTMPEWIRLGMALAFARFWDMEFNSPFAHIVVSHLTKSLTILGHCCLCEYRDSLTEMYPSEFASYWFKKQIKTRRITVVSLG